MVAGGNAGGLDGGLCCGKGRCAPIPACTTSAPCQFTAPVQTVTEPLTAPTCRTTALTRPRFDDGAPVRYPSAGFTRAVCRFVPPGRGKPLVVFLHGASGDASDVYNSTSLRSKASTFDLTGDGTLGFVLLAHQGLNTGANLFDNGPATRHEVEFRDPASPSTNPDVASLDALIDDAVTTLGVNPKRLFVMGWSNGFMFAQQYGRARRSTPTPGGNRVAAIAGFEGPEPYSMPRGGSACDARPLPAVALPVFMVQRDCSVVACDAAQRASNPAAPLSTVDWFRELSALSAPAPVTLRIITMQGRETPGCAATCGQLVALQNHVRWPDGVADGSGVDHERSMLEFLRQHPLP